MRYVVFLFLIFVLVGCGSSQVAAVQPSPQVVTRVVTQVVTVVVTTTPPPATPTLAVTATPEATAVPPTATPDPNVVGTLTKDIGMRGLPELGYKEKTPLKTGDTVYVRFKVDGWYAVKLPSNADAIGWVPADSLTLPEGATDRIEDYPDSLVVLDGEIVQQSLAGSVIFKGRVKNLGLKDAEQVHVEIETFDKSDNRVDLVQGYVDTLAVAAGDTGSFQGITQSDFDTFIAQVKYQ